MSGKDGKGGTGDETSNAGFDLDDLDWDAALNEWEQKTFVPEVAVDKETKAVAPPITPASTRMQSATPPPPQVVIDVQKAEAETFEPLEPTQDAPTTAMKPGGSHAAPPPSSSIAPAPASMSARPVALSANPPRIVPRGTGAGRLSNPPMPKISAPPRPPSSSSLVAATPDAFSRAIPPEPPTRVVPLLETGELANPSSAEMPAASVVPPPADSRPKMVPEAPASSSTTIVGFAPKSVEAQAKLSSREMPAVKPLAGTEDDEENTALFGRIFKADEAASAPASVPVSVSVSGLEPVSTAAAAAPMPPSAPVTVQRPSLPDAPPPSSPTKFVAEDLNMTARREVALHQEPDDDEVIVSTGGSDAPNGLDDPTVSESGSRAADELARTGEHVQEFERQGEAEARSERISIHAPPERTHDPDAVTNLVVLDEILKGGSDDAEPTRMRVRTALAAGSAPDAGEIRPAPVFEDEKRASEYLDDEKRARMLQRAERIEEEARTRREPKERARGLLVASELLAMAGERDQAAARATEAREIAPSMTLAHMQARTLGWDDHSSATRVAQLDSEARASMTLAGNVHALLLGADLLRAQGDEEAATERWEEASRTMPNDVRAPIARAARALSRGDLTAAAILEPALPPMLGSALATALRLRGHDEERAGDIPANDSLRRARAAFERHEIPAAAARIAEMRSVPELASAATWLASMVASTRPESRAESAQLLKPLAFKGDAEARRTLAARIVELGDAALGDELLSEPEPFAPAEWSVLQFLLGLSGSTNSLLDTVAEASPALGAALASVSLTGSDENPREARRSRARRVAGEPTARKLVTLGRLLADAAPSEDIAEAIAALGADAPESVRAVGLELALREGRVAEVAEALGSWLAEEDVGASARDRHLAAGLVAEAGATPMTELAIASYRAALAADRSDVASIRALFKLDPEGAGEATRWLNAAAEERGGTFGAMLRIEAAARVEGDHDRRAMILGDAHRAAPELALGAMLAERASRKAKDAEGVLQWIGQQRESASDSLEQALLDVRQAFASIDRAATATEDATKATHRAAAGDRLSEAHTSFPSDVALRELYERFASEAPTDRAAWRETRGAQATGASRVLYFLEAAHEYERAGDGEAALRAARAAHQGGDEGLARMALERAEEAAGDVVRKIEALAATVAPAGEGDAQARIETMERLADLESGRQETRASLAWHRKILASEGWTDHLPSLRALEHGLIGLGHDRDDGETSELGAIAASVARLMAKSSPFEASAHAHLAVRLHLKSGHPWEETRALTELASSLPEPALWSLRLADAHARAEQDDDAHLTITRSLIERTNQPAESAFLNVRAGEAALRLQRFADAAPFFEAAAKEDAGDIIAWGRLAEVRRRSGNLPGAGEALESLARTSLVPVHQRAAWVAAAFLWLDDVKDEDRGVVALEHAATLALGGDEIFDRLVNLYTKRGQRTELAELLERRLAAVKEPHARALLEVQRGRALAEIGDFATAATALESALDLDPDNLAALQSYAEVAMKRSDWSAAETSLVRLARLVSNPEEQAVIYGVLGDLYADRLGNLSRAETAFNEVLKHTPEDIKTLEKLAAVYKKQKDTSRAIEIQTQLVSLAKDPAARRQRMLEMAALHDVVGGDARRAEQVLEATRKESPLDVGVLRALVAFYERHKQGPAVNVLLDRVGGDARRAVTAGRVVPAQLEQLVAVYEMRGRQSAAAVVSGALKALRNEPSDVRGADGRALTPELDDLLAPELLSPSLRALLARTGDALDVAAPIDARAYKAVPLPASSAQLQQAIVHFAQAAGLAQTQVMASPTVGMTMIPCASAPPTILIGESLLPQGNDPARLFLAARVLKVVHAHASSLMRTPAAELSVLVSAWLNLFNPSWRPEGIPAAALGEAARKIKAGLPRQLPPDLSFAALEVAGALGPQMAQLGPATVTWANRVALLAVGDLRAAFDAIAWTSGLKTGAPTELAERATWIANNPEARDLLAFAVGDTYAEARTKLRLP